LGLQEFPVRSRLANKILQSIDANVDSPRERRSDDVLIFPVIDDPERRLREISSAGGCMVEGRSAAAATLSKTFFASSAVAAQGERDQFDSGAGFSASNSSTRATTVAFFSVPGPARGHDCADHER
jgi:hypothetical protein